MSLFLQCKGRSEKEISQSFTILAFALCVCYGQSTDKASPVKYLTYNTTILSDFVCFFVSENLQRFILPLWLLYNEINLQGKEVFTVSKCLIESIVIGQLHHQILLCTRFTAGNLWRYVNANIAIGFWIYLDVIGSSAICISPIDWSVVNNKIS